MDIYFLIETYPRLYHMAECGSWPNIEKYGLLSTSSLLDLYDIRSKDREIIESSHRPENIVISANKKADAVIRDQKPMSDRGLNRALAGSGLTPKDWYELLNNKTFFWTSTNRLHRLLNARAYVGLEHDVLIVDSESLIRDYEERIFLCPINSGCTVPFPHKRDASIFQKISEYDWDFWRKKRNRKTWDCVVEVCVAGGVPNIREYILSVSRMRGSNIIGEIYSR